MQRTSSPIPRSHVPQRVYSSEQYSIGSHGSYDQDSVGIGSPGGGGSGGGGGVMDTSFELMSATQLRDQLRVRNIFNGFLFVHFCLFAWFLVLFVYLFVCLFVVVVSFSTTTSVFGCNLIHYE